MQHFQPPVIDGVMLTSPETCEVGLGASVGCRIAGIRIMSMWRKRIRGKTKTIHGFVDLFVEQWQSTFSMEERHILWMI